MNISIPQTSIQFDAFSPSPEGGLIYIEQFTAHAGCQTPKRPWMMASNFITGQSMFFQPTCKKWSCPACGEVNARRWVARALVGVESFQAAGIRVDFVTLTSHEKLSAAASFRVFPHAWDQLSKRYKRAIPTADPGAYFAVPERHKSLKLHTHLIASGGLSKKWWKDNARECGLGYQSDVQEVATLGVGGYVSKYLGKTLAEKWPKNKRRVNTSRSWPALPDLPQAEGWNFSIYRTDDEIRRVSAALQADGFTVYGVTTEHAWQLLAELSPIPQENAT